MHLVWVLALGTISAPAATEPSVQDVVARHIEARGGTDRWKGIRTLRITGTMTAWSRKAPFTLERTGDGKYHLDTTQDGRKLEVGWDGQVAWWDNHFVQPGAQRLSGADLAVLMREIDNPTPFFDLAGGKHEVKTAVRTTYEGRDAIAVELMRADGLGETWYLDPKTFLEFARESPGSDFGRPVPMRTFYDDFRAVSGVRIPFRVESQWYTRERILEVEKVEVNPALDESRFGMPPPPGMDRFMALAGEWKVAWSRSEAPGAPWQDGERVSRIEPLLGGALVQERYRGAAGNEVIRQISYDRFRKRYRIAEIDDAQGLLNVMEGDLGEDGRLVVSNQTTGTPFLAFGFTIHGRLSIFEVGPDAFRTEEEISFDGGVGWIPTQKSTYTRAPDPGPDGEASPSR